MQTVCETYGNSQGLAPPHQAAWANLQRSAANSASCIIFDMCCGQIPSPSKTKVWKPLWSAVNAVVGSVVRNLQVTSFGEEGRIIPNSGVGVRRYRYVMEQCNDDYTMHECSLSEISGTSVRSLHA